MAAAGALPCKFGLNMPTDPVHRDTGSKPLTACRSGAAQIASSAGWSRCSACSRFSAVARAQVDGLPSANTQQADFGLDYNFPHTVRLNSSYSREFSKTGDTNIWDVSLTYRFLLPLWRGSE